MKNRLSTLLFLTALPLFGIAQNFNQLRDDGTFTAAGYQEDKNFGRSDSIQSRHKEIPRGLKVWTIDERFGDKREAVPDTLSPMFMNTIFTTGLRGEYNTLGNVGSPRINRIFIDRVDATNEFFTDPYDFFLTPVSDFHFTNTLSPITNISYNTAGSRTNGEDHLKALFAVNAGKRLGLGMKFDYIYGRGYYSNQNTSHFNYTLFGSYLGDRYQAHLLMSTNHQKVSENGGIANDDYILHPESFNESYTEEEIPTVLQQNWNRNDNQHIFFNHRYSLGFKRKVPMTKDEIEARKFAIKAKKEQDAKEAKDKARRRAMENGEDFDEEEYDNEVKSKGRPADAKIIGVAPSRDAKTDNGRIIVDGKAAADSLLAAKSTEKEDTVWMKDEYVPVTSFIHTAKFDNYRRIYQAYDTPTDYYLNTYENIGKFGGDSIYDKTRHWALKNTFAVALLEGFNKWAKAGLKVFATHELRHFSLPETDGSYKSFNENVVTVGGQLRKRDGKLLHYNVTGEIGVAGEDAGMINIDADADLNFKLFGDTVQLAARGFFHKKPSSFYYSHYQSKHFWWDNENFDDLVHTRIEGQLSIKKTRTRLRVAVDNVKNYSYLGMSYDLVENSDNLMRINNAVEARQCGDAVNLFTVQLNQDFRLGILNWENQLTYQTSSKEDVIAVPKLNIYSNLFIRFKIAKVLKCDFGADVRYFSKYYAPEYSPALGQYAVQENPDIRVKTGAYPIVNAYANFHLKNTRFFVMMSHVNYSEGGEYFLTPHYPLNQRIIRFGLSWNFFN